MIASAAALLSVWGILPPGNSLVCALMVLIGLPTLILAASFFRAILSGAGTARSPCWFGQFVRALAVESIRFPRMIVAMIGAPWRRPVGIDDEGGQRARPVLLIHGIVCNSAVWEAWLRPLSVAGFAPVRCVNLEPLFADIDAHASGVAQVLRDLQQECGGARIAIVAHSMGGLVARAALCRAGPRTVCRLVTIASPHHGSSVASLFPWRPTQQMRPDSTWLRALEASEGRPPSVPVTSIFSLQDNLVVPACSAAMPDAENHALSGLGHIGVLSSHRAIACAITALQAR
jgi:pimeloyl-ACP methyl ester carboxylesterase